MGRRNGKRKQRKSQSASDSPVLPRQALLDEKVRAEIGKISAETGDIEKRYRLDVLKAVVASIAAIGTLVVGFIKAFGG